MPETLAERIAEKYVWSIQSQRTVDGFQLYDVYLGGTNDDAFRIVCDSIPAFRDDRQHFARKAIVGAIREFAEAVAEKIRPERFAEDDCFVTAHKDGIETAINGLLREAGIEGKSNGR